MADKRDTGDSAPADRSEPSREERRAALLRQLAERTFPDLQYAKLREPNDTEQER